MTPRPALFTSWVCGSCQLCGYVGEQVEVRHMPHHDEAVEVFLGERHLGTAVLVNRMSRGDAHAPGTSHKSADQRS